MISIFERLRFTYIVHALPILESLFFAHSIQFKLKFIYNSRTGTIAVESLETARLPIFNLKRQKILCIPLYRYVAATSSSVHQFNAASKVLNYFPRGNYKCYVYSTFSGMVSDLIQPTIDYYRSAHLNYI